MRERTRRTGVVVAASTAGTVVSIEGDFTGVFLKGFFMVPAGEHKSFRVVNVITSRG
jgi:hypothetical protein